MGVLFSRLWTALFKSNQQFKIVIVGLNAAGKTTILYKWHLGMGSDAVKTTPTIGSNCESIQYKNLTLEAWDLGGQDASRPSWSTYFADTNAVILVIDSADRERLFLVKDELKKILAHEALRTSCLMVMANKQDVKGSMTAAEISDALTLHSIKSHTWSIQPCCAITGDGLMQSLDWLAEHIKQQNRAGS
eukprot:tig00000571_g2201.t1